MSDVAPDQNPETAAEFLTRIDPLVTNMAQAMVNLAAAHGPLMLGLVGIRLCEIAVNHMDSSGLDQDSSIVRHVAQHTMQMLDERKVA